MTRRKSRRRGRTRIVRVEMKASCEENPPTTVTHWVHNVRRKKAGVLVQRPHHYAVSLGLTLLLLSFGHVHIGEHLAAWGYAILENLTHVE